MAWLLILRFSIQSATLAIVWALFFAPKTAWNGWGGFTVEQAVFLFTQGSFGALFLPEESRTCADRTRFPQVLCKLQVNGGPG